MLRNDLCRTKNEEIVFEAIVKLSKNSACIAIQELDNLGISRNVLEEILSYFESRGLFSMVQHLSSSHPTIFSLKGF